MIWQAGVMKKRSKPLDANKYRGQWVAFRPATEEVVGHGSTLRAAEKQALKRGVKSPVLYQVASTAGYYVG